MHISKHILYATEAFQVTVLPASRRYPVRVRVEEMGHHYLTGPEAEGKAMNRPYFYIVDFFATPGDGSLGVFRPLARIRVYARSPSEARRNAFKRIPLGRKARANRAEITHEKSGAVTTWSK